jgi:uncharacterized membrane protein
LGKLSDAKVLGGIGSILQIIPFLSIVGYILTLLAVKFVSDEVQDSSIFTDMLYAVVAGIIGFTVGAFILFFGVIASPFTLGVGAILGGISFLVVVWVVLILSSVFIRRAFDKMATKLGVGTFRTAGMLYFIGALLTIILVGFLIIFIAFILQVVAFFSIPDNIPGAVSSMQPPPPAQPGAPVGSKFCPNCGTQMPSTSAFCPKCGARQP